MMAVSDSFGEGVSLPSRVTWQLLSLFLPHKVGTVIGR